MADSIRPERGARPYDNVERSSPRTVRDAPMWPSLETASTISTTANLALVVSLVVGVLATALIVWAGGIKEQHWNIARNQAQEKIAMLELETMKAQERTLEL